ncbi:hypothetical protein D7Z26_23110 [Cohnella endophytica]|uniref:Copper amine oxidase-like N-terminal domain-containing protein n=1 Tax=Cohnella endophytica TaxID=2419778 RepID=A0A494XGI7_9BACL|nr:stalk domain-containing protein [Cohnella endophytica]RKP47204.1 hypothetical protein D7Z26_23110 [Cohnella endophytica]
MFSFEGIKVTGKSAIAVVLTAIVFLLCALPAAAATTSGSKVEIRVKVGSAQMKINGEAIKIQAPYLSAGNAMVPLSVFTNTKGFGAKLQLTNNKIIKLTYLKHIVTLTVGNKSAMIDGKKAELPAAPVSKNGTMMVPLAIVAKTFGAAQSTDANTKEIVLSGITPASASSGNAGSGIDTDMGKSLMGDSYYKWTMNYPTGLIQDKQWSDGSWLSFSDVKGDYYLAISVEKPSEVLSSSDIRENLMDYLDDGETVVDVKTIVRPGGTFERVVTKASTFYYEYRSIQANGYLYTITYGKKAKSSAELTANDALLDSFKPSFNTSNKAIKDLTRIIDGKIAFESSTYGLKVQLPQGWNLDSNDSSPNFYGKDGSRIHVAINSIKAGDTTQEWLKRKFQYYKDTIVDSAMKGLKTTEITWNGIPATLVEDSYTDDSKTWTSEYEVYAIKGNYKYYVNYSFKGEDKAAGSAVLDQILKGMTIDFSKIEKTFGDIPDPIDSLDYRTVVTKTSVQDNFSLTLPKYWTKSNINMDSGELLFEGFGVKLSLNVEAADSLEGYPEALENLYTQSGLLKIDSKTNITYAGVSAIKYELSSGKLASKLGHITVYLFANKGKVYFLQAMSNDANATDFNRAQLDAAINSFKFTN